MNPRRFDPLKLKVAAYYYNRAAVWKKEVSLSTKDHAYLAGSILDFERSGRAPKELTDFVWLGTTGGGDNTREPVSFDLQQYVNDAIQAGRKRLVVPPGRYRVTPKDQQHLVLRNLKDVEIS